MGTLFRLFVLSLLVLSVAEMFPPPARAAESAAPAGTQADAGGSIAPVPSATAVPSRLPSGRAFEQPADEQPMRNLPSGMLHAGSHPAWMQPAPAQARERLYPPFGASLFQGNFAGTYYEGMNADYVLMPGDRLVVHIWGAHGFSGVVAVDQQGNIFLPEIGPIPVAGLRHGALSGHVRSFVSSVFTSNVDVYVNLLTAQAVAVYVTGFVRRPGRYAGGMNDSVLYYLDRAGGILPERGTYRNIQVQRRNRTIAAADLYDFILNGRLPGGALHDGDVIVVGPKGGSVFAGGYAPQHAAYEIKGNSFSGEDLTAIAAPFPAVSHVGVSGTRNADPFRIYMDMEVFRNFPLAADDRVDFLADRPGETIMVGVSGAVPGPTHYPVRRGATLRSVLAHVPIRPELSNLGGLYIKRGSVREQQRKMILDSLHRLETSVLITSPANQESAAIQLQEAQLVRDFVARASRVEPDGVVVVTRNGVVADIVLEDGDEIVIPQRSDVVQIHGEVQMPKAVVHAPAFSVGDYLREAGGLTVRGDFSNILVAHPNGEIAPAGRTAVLPGDLLLVLPRNDSKGFSIFKDIVQVIFQIALSAKVVLS